MELYITFGSIHRHEINGKVYDRDCIAVIDCKNASHGRDLAHNFFGPKFATSYTEDQLDDDMTRHFPRGLISVNGADSNGE